MLLDGRLKADSLNMATDGSRVGLLFEDDEIDLPGDGGPAPGPTPGRAYPLPVGD
jgi:hypothetical protein